MMAQFKEMEEARRMRARRLEDRRRLAEQGFRLRFDRLQRHLQEAVLAAREAGAQRACQALDCAAALLTGVAEAGVDPALFRRTYAHLSNFLRAADTLARRAEQRRLVPCIRAGLVAAFSFGWWWRVNIQRTSPENAILWLSGTRHAIA